MATETETRPSTPVGVWLLGAVVGLAAIGLVAVAWKGCGAEDPLTAAKREAEAKKKDEDAKKKEVDPRVEHLVIQPGEPQSELQFVKPGHWATATQRMRGVYQDFVGEEQISVVNGRGEMYPVDATPFMLQSTRPVALSKGRPKNIETTFLAPQVNRAVQLRTELVERGFGRSLRSVLPVTRMPSYQYYFVVLASEPNRYGFVKSLDSVEVPWDGESDADDTEDPLHYRVVSLGAAPTIPLPDNPLVWTSIAYLLWDEVDPKLFTPEQERALVDWLHWGGQLIVNGPDSLDLLKGSFLEPLLPAASGGSRKITADDLAALNDKFLIVSPRGDHKRLVPTAPWSGVNLQRIERPGEPEIDAVAGATDELLMERPVGRGRIVVSAMQLAERDLVNWRGGFESWFNACILRRPNREYHPGYFGDFTLAWAEPKLADRRLDAQLTTGLRYLARDLGVDTNYQYVDVTDQNAAAWQYGAPQSIRELRPPDRVGGLGAWNDFSATANAAREALVDAAGVEVPGTSFVVVCLTLYLVALVPLNWLVFHAIGRVEWAWIAAPIIAVAGTWAIVDRARLDIGFVRAQTEIGLLELQPNYDRGHLSRYTALYTSLSTTYDLEFNSLTAVAAPFPTSANPQGTGGAGNSVCDFQRYDAVRLSGVFVPSNSTNMVHSEQMLLLDGAIQLGASQSQRRQQIENRSQFHLRSVAIVERTSREEEQNKQRPAEPGLRGIWIGELRPGTSALMTVLRPLIADKDKSPFADERAAEERLQHTPRLDLEPTFRLALDVNSFEPGEKRLVARVDEVLPGETISPAASQIQGAVLVIAHLSYGPRPEPEPDLNTRLDPAKE